MLSKVRNTIKRGRQRAAKLADLSQAELVATSISHVFFAFSLTVVLLYGWAEQIYHDEFSNLAKLAYGATSIIFLLLSYLAFERVKSIDFWDFIAGMLFTREIRGRPHGKAVDLAASQLYFGLVLIAVAPIFVKYYSNASLSAGLLTLGGLLVATGFAVYAISGMKLRE